MDPDSASLPSRTRRAALLAAGRAASAVVGIASLAILSRLLSKSEYATYQQTLLVYGTAAPFLAMGLLDALNYFLPTSGDRARSVLIENLALLSAAGMAFAVFLLAGGRELVADQFNNTALSATLLVLAPYALFTLITDAAVPCLVVAGRTGRLAIFNVSARTLVLVLTAVPAAIWSATALAGVMGMVCAAGIGCLLAVALMWSAMPEGPFRPRFSGMREQLRYALPLGVSQMLAGLTYSLDKWVVAWLGASPEEYAVFVNGAFEAPLVGIVAGSTTVVLLPEVVRLYRAGQRDDAAALWQRAMVKMACLLLPAAAFLFVLAPQVMVLLFSERYVASATVFRIYLLLLLVRTGSWTVVPQAANRTVLMVGLASVGLAVNSMLTLAGFRLFGPPGAAAATVISLGAVLAPLYAICSARLLGRSVWELVPWWRLGRIAVLVAGPVAALTALTWLPWPPLLVVAGGAALFAPACYWLLTRFAECPRAPFVERVLGGNAVDAERR